MSAIPGQIMSCAPEARPVPVAIYTRVSTIHQVGGRFDSCESQAVICRDYILKRASEGWFEVACFSDPAYSGGTMNRPGIQALMRQIEAGQVKVVLIYKLERMLRSTDEWAPLRAFLHRHGCRLVSTTEDLSDETPSGRLKNNLIVSVSEYERLNTADKIRAKLLEMAKRGIWAGGMVPFGYDYDPKEQMLHPHPEEAKIVKRVFEEAARLVSLTDIANQLSAEGISTRRRTMRSRDGNRREMGGIRFRCDTLRPMIKNAIYMGKIRMNGQCWPGQHEAIVSEKLWEKANAAISNPITPYRQRLRSPDKHFNLLKGILECGCCHRSMSPAATNKCDLDGKPYRYYRCTHVQKERTRSNCQVRRVSGPAIERACIAFLGECCSHPEILRHTAESVQQRDKTDHGALRATIAGIDRKLEDIGQQLRNFAEAVTVGGFSSIPNELKERAMSLNTEKQQRLVERERLCQDLAACDHEAPNMEDIRHALEKFNHLFPTLEKEQQRDLVSLAIRRVEIFPAAGPGLSGKANSALREYSLRIHLCAASLVEKMSGQIMLEEPRRQGATLPPRLITLETKVTINITRTVASVLLSTSHHQVKVALKAPGEKGWTPPVVQKEHRHPIHRALIWSRRLTNEPALSKFTLAKQSGVAPGTVTHHLKLLQLAPQIQTFLLNITSPADLQLYSLNRMKALAERSHEAQLSEFARLRKRRALALSEASVSQGADEIDQAA